MSKIAIVFWSGTGNTEAMAGYVEEGAKGAGAQVQKMGPDEFKPEMVQDYDAIAFGCPAMGDEELEETEFAPMFEAVKGSLSGKKIALFGSYDWGEGDWMESWKGTCLEAGAVLSCDPVIANNEPDEEAADKLKEMGKGLAG